MPIDRDMGTSGKVSPYALSGVPANCFTSFGSGRLKFIFTRRPGFAIAFLSQQSVSVWYANTGVSLCRDGSGEKSAFVCCHEVFDPPHEDIDFLLGVVIVRGHTYAACSR